MESLNTLISLRINLIKKEKVEQYYTEVPSREVIMGLVRIYGLRVTHDFLFLRRYILWGVKE